MQEKRFQNRIKIFTYALTILVIWVHSVNLTPEILSAAGIAAAGAADAVDITNTAGTGDIASAALYRFACALETFFTDTLGQTAVPGFFMVSAFLFFRKLPERTEKANRTRQTERLEKANRTDRAEGIKPTGGKKTACLSPTWVLQKWKRRFFSLFLPFVIWNLLYYLLHLLAGSAEALLGMPQTERVPFDLSAVLSAALLYTYNPVFWYLYQLILLTLLAPALFYLMRGKKSGAVFLVLSFFAAVFWERLPFHPVNEDALFYYLLGIYGALHGKDLIETGRHAVQAMSVIIGLLILWCMIFQTGMLPEAIRQTAAFAIARSVSFRAAVPLLLYFLLTVLMLRGEERLRCGEQMACREQTEQLIEKLPGFMEISFFIYATHYLVIKTVHALLFSVLAELSSGTVILTNSGILLLLAVYFLLPLICTAAAYLGSRAMKQFMPEMWKLLSGGR